MPRSSRDHGFHRHEWFQMLRDHCFADRQIVMAQACGGAAQAVLPLVKDGSQLNALANYYSFSYGPVFAGQPSGEDQSHLIADIAGQLRSTARRVSLFPLFDEDGLAEMLRAAFAKAGWIALLTEQSTNHMLHVDGRAFADYWEARPGRLRSAVIRKGKTGHYRFAIHEKLTDALWTDYCAVYAASWKNAEPYPAMIRAIADDAARRGALRLGFAHRGDCAVAAQLWTIEGDTACIQKVAHDRSEDSGSPGTLLSHHMFAHMIDREKIARIDYGTGDNGYKRDWMDMRRPVLRLDCFDPRSAAMWLPALKTRISRLVGR